MARLNSVNLLGIVKNEEIESREIRQDDGSFIPVINLSLECFVKEDDRSYRLPVAVWGKENVDSCKKHLQPGDLIYADGELRYHFYQNEKTKRVERVYTTVKTEIIEFVTEEMGRKPEELDFLEEIYTNEVKIMGNVMDQTPNGIIIGVDRLPPPVRSRANISNEKFIDFITVVPSKRFKQKGKMQKGDFVMVKGNLITRRKQKNIAIPRIVVSADMLISGYN